MLRERWETTWSKWFRGRRPIEASELKISAGDRFYRRSSAHHVWIVDRVYTPLGQAVPHVRMFRMDEESDCRMLSEPSLLDRQDFGRDRRKVQKGDPAQFARRVMDKPGGHVRSRLEAPGK